MKKDLLFVLVQFLLFVLYFLPWEVIPVEFPDVLDYVGILAIAAGILTVIFGIVNLSDSLSPFPSPKADSVLIQHGIYKYIRHPIYTGILCAFFGYGLFASAITKVLITVVLAIVFYFKSSFEEQLLETRYLQYKHYKKTTGRFLPKWFNKKSE